MFSEVVLGIKRLRTTDVHDQRRTCKRPTISSDAISYLTFFFSNSTVLNVK